MTEGTGALAAALAKVQAELPTLDRDRTVEVQQKNGGTYSYSYVTLGHLTEAVMPLLSKHGLAFAAAPDAGADGKLCLRYWLLHDSGEQLTGEFPISGEGGIQMVGGRITYGRRYLLSALVGVAADEDDESRLQEGVAGTAQRRQPPAKKAAAQAPAKKTAQRSTAKTAEAPPLPNENADGMSAEQRSKLMATFADMGVEDRTERLRISSEIVGRELSSANDMTRDEVRGLIDELVRRQEKPFDPTLAAGYQEGAS